VPEGGFWTAKWSQIDAKSYVKSDEKVVVFELFLAKSDEKVVVFELFLVKGLPDVWNRRIICLTYR